MMKNIKLAFFLLLALNSITMAQNVPSNIDSLKRMVVEVEKKINIQEKELNQFQEKLNFIHTTVIETKEMAYQTDRELWKLGLGWFSGIGALAFSVIGFWVAFFGTTKYLENKIKAKLDAHLNDEKWSKALNTKIQKHLAENELKEKIKILVISNDGDSEKIIKNYFQENKFNGSRIFYKQGSDLNLNEIDFDILFINNMGNKFNLPLIQPKVAPFLPTAFDALINGIKNSKELKKAAVFYFNDNQNRFPDHLDNGLDSSFTNSLASLYHNLLDLMRYKYIVLDNKNFD